MGTTETERRVWLCDACRLGGWVETYDGGPPRPLCPACEDDHVHLSMLQGLDPRVQPGAMLTIYYPEAVPDPIYRVRPLITITVVRAVCPSWASNTPNLVQCERDGKEVYFYPREIRIAD